MLVLAACLASFLSSTAFSLPVYFNQRYGDNSNQWATGVATAPDGSMVVVGTFQGTVNFGGANLVSAGSNDIFVAKFSVAGSHVWSMSFGNAASQEARAVAIDDNYNVYVAGHFEGSFVVGGTPFTSAGGTDVYFLKLSSTGTLIAGQRFGDANWQFCNALAVDAAGNFAMAGAFVGTINFGGGILTSAGDYDAFLVKFNTSATHVWSQRFGDTVWQDASAVAIDLGGNVVMGGHYSGTFSFGGPNLTGSVNVYVAKFNSAGVHQWSKGFGDAAGQYCNGVATDLLGSVVITGFMDGVMNFGGGNLTGVGDLFLAKFDATGAHQWSKKFGDASAQDTRAIVCDSFNNIVIAGHIIGSIDLGGGVLTSAGNIDLLIAKFDPAGAHLWSRRYGDAFEQQNPRLTLGPNNEIVLAGYFSSTLSFGAGNLVSSGGSYDVFLARLSEYPIEPVITSIVDIGNDQGRKVRIRFARSYYDLGSTAGVHRYEAYRRDDPPPGSSAEGRDIAIDGWTEVGSVAAHVENSYGIDVPTIADSTVAAGMYTSTFFIRAATPSPEIYHDSAPFSGYSVDNLSPGIPLGFAYSAGNLSWQESSAEDFDYFSVYGGNTNSFGAAILLDYTVSPGLAVAGYTYYFVTATDFAGNEGKPAVVNASTGIGETPPSYVLSVSAYPNPFNPETTVRYTVPSQGRVTITIYDARGVPVRSLLDEEKEAGAFTVEWNGSGDNGSTVSSGVYFARVAHPSGTKSYKMVLLK